MRRGLKSAECRESGETGGEESVAEARRPLLIIFTDMELEGTLVATLGRWLAMVAINFITTAVHPVHGGGSSEQS